MASRFRFRILLCIVIICFYHVGSNAQVRTAKVRPFISQIAKKMAGYNRIDSQSIGEGGMESKQWDRFEKLQKVATDAELRQLTKHPNAAVRCYAFHAIALRRDTAIFSILISHLKDTSQVETLSSDLGGWYEVCDYFVDLVTPQYIDLNAYKLDRRQKATLDSILLYDKNIRSGAKDNMLRQIKPDAKYYERMKEIAQTENNGEGLIALSKYRNPNDTTLIISYLNKPKEIYYALYAVREFPAPAFYSQLVKIFEYQWLLSSFNTSTWRMLCQALAQYPTSQTLALFERAIQAKDYYRRQNSGVNLLVALTRYPNPYFEKLKTQIRLDDVYRDGFLEEMKTNN